MFLVRCHTRHLPFSFNQVKHLRPLGCKLTFHPLLGILLVAGETMGSAKGAMSLNQLVSRKASNMLQCVDILSMTDQIN